MGALTENHRCPRGPFHRIVQAISTVVLGSILGAVFCFLLYDQPAGALVLAAAALGAVLATAVRDAIGGRP
jgi:uncharacterized membrane protein YccC